MDVHVIGYSDTFKEFMEIDAEGVDFIQVGLTGRVQSSFCLDRTEAIAAAKAILAHYGVSYAVGEEVW